MFNFHGLSLCVFNFHDLSMCVQFSWFIEMVSRISVNEGRSSGLLAQHLPISCTNHSNDLSEESVLGIVGLYNSLLAIVISMYGTKLSP